MPIASAASLEAELQKQPEFRAAMDEAAAKAAEMGNRFNEAGDVEGPWMPPKRRGGRRVIEVQRVGDELAVVNTDHAGHLIEWGSKNNPPHAVLRRAVRAAGLTLTEAPKDAA